jgi:hypothetical protein
LLRIGREAKIPVKCGAKLHLAYKGIAPCQTRELRI